MANMTAAKKSIRQSARRAVFNLRVKRAMKSALKSVRTLIVSKEKKSALELLPQVYKTIDKAVKRGVLKKNTASRTKSRVTRAIDKLD